MGWNIGLTGDDVPKCVICVAPHTSNTDFLIGKLFYNAVGKQAKFLADGRCGCGHPLYPFVL